MPRLTVAAAILGAVLAIGCHRPRNASEPVPGASYGPESPPPDETRTIVTRDLGAVAADACDVEPLVQGFGGAKCKRVPGEAATGSEAATSANAFDANACTTWN